MNSSSLRIIAKVSAICACVIGVVDGAGITSRDSYDESLQVSQHGNAPDYDLSDCPVPCEGNDPMGWSVYRSPYLFASCRAPVLFQPANDDSLDLNMPSRIRACSARGTQPGTLHYINHIEEEKKLEDPHGSPTTIAQSIDIATTSNKYRNRNDQEETLVALQTLWDVMIADDDRTTTEPRHVFSYYQGAFAGAYAGSGSARYLVPSAFQVLADQLTGPTSTVTAAQVCGDEYDADSTIGVAVTSLYRFSALHDAVQSWSNGMCALGFFSRGDEETPVVGGPRYSSDASPPPSRGGPASRRHRVSWSILRDEEEEEDEL